MYTDIASYVLANTIMNIDDCLQLQRDSSELEKWTKLVNRVRSYIM